MPDYIPHLQTPDGLAEQTGQMRMQNSQIIPNALQSAMQSIAQGLMQRRQFQMQQGQSSAIAQYLASLSPAQGGQTQPGAMQPVPYTGQLTGQQSVEGQPQAMQAGPAQAQAAQPNGLAALARSPLPFPAHLLTMAGQMAMMPRKQADREQLVTDREQAQEKLAGVKADLKPVAAKSANQQAMDDRQANTRWDKFTTQMDAAKASSRSLIGQAMQNNMRSRRALIGVNDPGMIPQQLDAAVSDYASMMKGGSADMASMDHSRFNNFATKWANLKAEITSKPQALNTPEVANKLQQMLKDVVSVDDNATKHWVKYHESANSDLIKTHKEQWEGMKNELLNLTSGDSAAPGAGAAPAGKFDVNAHLKSMGL